jgi:hypothetical protein
MNNNHMIYQVLNRGLLRIVLVCSLSVSSVFAAESNNIDDLRPTIKNEWHLIKNDKHRQIKTYAKLEDKQKIRSFKVEGQLKAKAETLLRVLLDFSNYNNWYWEVQESRLLKQVSATEYYLYLVHRAPYGLPNRDVILHAVIEPQSKSQNYVLLTVKAVPDFLPLQPKLIRMPAENMTIKFTPVSNNLIQIDAEGFINPAGNVPAWDANLIQRNAPYAVTLGLQRMALQEKYVQSHSELPFPIFNYDNLP